jgi:hypothetical protein
MKLTDLFPTLLFLGWIAIVVVAYLLVLLHPYDTPVSSMDAFFWDLRDLIYSFFYSPAAI